MRTRMRRLTADLEVAENMESHVSDELSSMVQSYLQRLVEPALSPEDPFAITSLTVRTARDAEVSGETSPHGSPQDVASLEAGISLMKKRAKLVLPLRIDTDAYVVTTTGIVLDANNEFVAEYETIDEAEVVVASVNGVDVATLRQQMEESARMRNEYLRRLRSTRGR